MSTRRKQSDTEETSQERWMSSEEYAALRSINGLATAAKAALITDPDLRRLLFAIQGRSRTPGGLVNLARELVDTFPQKAITGALSEKHLKPAATLNAQDFDWIKSACRFTTPKELDAYRLQCIGDCGDLLDEPPPRSARAHQEASKPATATPPVPAIEALNLVRRTVIEKLPAYLIQLCVNPYIQLTTDDRYQDGVRLETGDAEDKFVPAGVAWFQDLVPCLLELLARTRKRVVAEHALTSAGRTIWKQLDFCLRTGEMVVIQGREGIGKSEAVKAWVAAHEGECRYLQLTSTTNQTEFFRELAGVLGVACSYMRTVKEMKPRAADVLRRSKLMLILDEGHYLLPQTQRVETRPLLLDWLYSGLNNFGVPVAVIATPQFSQLAAHVEKRTGWNADQFLRRAKRFTDLPARLEADDLRLVAGALLTDGTETMVKTVAVFGGMKEHQLDAMKDLVREARFIAEGEGRKQIRIADLERAMKEEIEPTLLAKVKAMGRLKTEKQGGVKRGAARPMQAPCNVAELPLQRGATMAPGRGITPGSGDAEEEFADAPALAG